MIPGSGRCHYHPDRAGLGVCVECRRVICLECTTQFEGINRCANCLTSKARKADGPKPRQDWRFGPLFWAAAGFSAVLGVVYLAAKLYSGI